MSQGPAGIAPTPALGINFTGTLEGWLLRLGSSPGCCIVPWSHHQVAPAHSGRARPSQLAQFGGSLGGGGCPVRCGSSSSISGLHSLEVGSMRPLPQGDNLNHLQTLPNIPCREKLLGSSQSPCLGPCFPAFIYCVSSVCWSLSSAGARSPEALLLAELTPRHNWPPGAG